MPEQGTMTATTVNATAAEFSLQPDLENKSTEDAPDSSRSSTSHSEKLPELSETVTFTPRSLSARLLETLLAFLPLGFTTLGGPQATISQYFGVFVVRLQWITERTYTELFGITQSLPGPGNAGMSWSIALIRNGLLCAFVSFLVWTAPSLWVYIGVAIALALSGGVAALPGWAVGIENGAVGAAVGLVSLAAFRLTQKVVLLNGVAVKPTSDMSAARKSEVMHNRNRRVFALTVCVVTILLTILISAVWVFPVVMVAAGMAGFTYEYGHERRLWSKLTEVKEKWFRSRRRSEVEEDLERASDKKAREEAISVDRVATTGAFNGNAKDNDKAKTSTELANDDDVSEIEVESESMLQTHDPSYLDVPMRRTTYDTLSENNLRRRPSLLSVSEASIAGINLTVPRTPAPASTAPAPNPHLAITFTGHAKPTSPPLAPYFPATKRNMIPLLIVYFLVLATGFAFKFGNIGGTAGNLYGMCIVLGVITFGGWGALLPILTSWAVEQYGFISASELTFLVALQNALPGPLFNIAGFVGAMAFRQSGAAAMALAGFLSFLAIFAPGMLLFSLVTPSYAKLREYKASGWVFSGVNAAATGLMWQAAYIIGTKAISGRNNGPSILGYPVFLGLAVVTFVCCSDFRGDGSGGVNPVWMIVLGAMVGVVEWAIVVRT